MSANVDPATGAVERCVSCGAPLAGPYCWRCGERTLEPEALTLRPAATLIYVLNTAFMTAVQAAGAAIALALI